ncbi:MAG: tetratricopeptide repeat protein [Saprospiraceae bacterium]|nr:tetratricopeptide repeat protein [Saprospiraceae bacterium]
MHKLCFIILISCLIACNSESAKTLQEIANLEAKLAEQPSQQILQELLALYQDMASKTRDEKRLDFLWKAGETARAARDFQTAESIFKELYENNKGTDLAAKSLFLHAFMCDEDMKDHDKARELYQSFLTSYPDSDFNDDAQFLLDNLGKTDEEMLELLSKSKPGSEQ